MFGFLKNKSSVKDAQVLTELDNLKLKCKVLGLEQAQFLIPTTATDLSDTECELLYKSWKTEVLKTPLIDQVMNNELFYFQNSSAQDHSKLLKLFESLNLKELTISVNSQDGDPSVYSYKNDEISSGLTMEYKVDPYSYDNLTIKNSDNVVVFEFTVDSIRYSRENQYDHMIRKIIPGGWISDISQVLEHIKVYRDAEHKAWLEQRDLDHASQTRTFISEAIDMN